ncbi:MAG: hypothetical protein ABI584_15275 [Acidobacteriota bacterium]
MRDVPTLARFQSIAAPLVLLCASLAFLCAGGLLAAGQHGALRAAIGGGGFTAYVYFFARALDQIGIGRSGAL